jgi:hypothetical protein
MSQTQRDHGTDAKENAERGTRRIGGSGHKGFYKAQKSTKKRLGFMRPHTRTKVLHFGHNLLDTVLEPFELAGFCDRKGKKRRRREKKSC